MQLHCRQVAQRCIDDPHMQVTYEALLVMGAVAKVRLLERSIISGLLLSLGYF
jgi:hypothetical protein